MGQSVYMEVQRRGTKYHTIYGNSGRHRVKGLRRGGGGRVSVTLRLPYD